MLFEQHFWLLHMLYEYVVLLMIIFLFFLFLRGVFSKFVVKRLENYVSKSTNNFDNSLVFSMEGPAKFFPVVLGFFVFISAPGMLRF